MKGTKGVWDGLDKERVGRAVVLAYMSDEYLEVLSAINNAETPDDVVKAREGVKELMTLWREECPEYAFMIDCLYLFSERMHEMLSAESAESESGE